ncbi:MAG: GspE/PulE family protein [Chlamydiia bacterium]
MTTTIPLAHDEELLKGIPLVPYAFAKKYRLIPYGQDATTIYVACSDANSFEALEDIRFKTKKLVHSVVRAINEIDQAIEECYHKSSTESDGGESGEQELYSSEGYDLLDQAASTGVIRLCNTILIEAITQKASDIHFEPQENMLQVRFRIDGVLHERKLVQKTYQDELITRLKVLSKLDIAESRLPQDGRMKLSIGEREIDFRVSTVPVVFGERVVLRILDKKNIHLGLDAIGLPEDLLANLKHLLTKTQGIFLVTGPTGSGKTTTLYSALKEIQSSEMNIMTIEDPVEYKLPHMAQIGVNPKINLSFSTGLRHILRQDPDVIMVGEIRDKETAEIAIQASLTGHLVLSTLHTNDALSAPIRLIDMGIEPFLISSSLIGILAQRLVRVICPACKEGYSPSDEELKDLKIKEGRPQLYRGRGCAACFGLGYKGRVGIYELLLLSPRMKTLLHQEQDPAKRQELAEGEGFMTLRQQGIRSVLEGITTVEEIIRVTGKGEL